MKKSTESALAMGLKCGVFNLLHPRLRVPQTLLLRLQSEIVCRGLCSQGLTQALGDLASRPSASAGGWRAESSGRGHSCS